MGTFDVKRVIGIIILVILSVGGYVYSNKQPEAPSFSGDPKALEALELIKTHMGRKGKTLDQWVNHYIEGLKKAGTPIHVGEWQVGAEGNDSYHVRKLIREKGAREWIQREFAWRVNVQDKSIRVISLAAVQFMLLHELPPLPHQDQISSGPLLHRKSVSQVVATSPVSPKRVGVFFSLSI